MAGKPEGIHLVIGRRPDRAPRRLVLRLIGPGAQNVERHGVSRDGQLFVVGGKVQVLNLRPCQQRRCQVNGVERAEERRKRFGGALEDEGASPFTCLRSTATP